MKKRSSKPNASKPRKSAPAHFQTPEFREAASDFINGLWESDHRLDMFRTTMHSIWQHYKRSPQYEGLRQRLSEAAQSRRQRDT